MYIMLKSISAVDTAFLLENNSEAVILDVREKDELSICHIERALQEKGQQNALILTDGINDWAKTVDRKMSQY